MNIENTALRHEYEKSLLVAHPERLRSDGVLTGREASRLRSRGIPLAFDPVQIGWVPLECEDDISSPDRQDTGFDFREWTPADTPTLSALLSSEALWRYMPEEYHGPIEADAAAQLIEIAKADHHHVLAVCLNGVAIGQVRLLFEESGRAELSYWLGEEYWGKGYASAFVDSFCRKSFAELPELSRLFARVHVENIASQRVLRKASFDLASEDGDWLIFEQIRTSDMAR